MVTVWQVECRGFTFGDGTQFPWQASGPDLFGWSNLAVSDVNLPGRDGFVTTGQDRFGSGSRKMSLPFWADGSSEEEVQYLYQDFATAFAPGDVEVTLRTPLRDYTIYARPREVAMPAADMLRSGFLAPCAVQLVLTDPNLYGQMKVATVGMSASSGGMGFPHGFPHGFGSTITQGGTAATITNEGNRATPVQLLIRANGGMTDPVVGRYFTNDALRFSGLTLDPGKWLLIDTGKRRAVVADDIEGTNAQSVAHLVDWPTSRWWLAPPGDSVVVLGGTGIGAGSVVYRDAYLI